MTLSIERGLYVADMFKVHGVPVEFTGKVPSMYVMPPKGERAIRVGISALGGGTVGKAYADQTWVWGVWSRGRLVASGDDLRSNSIAATHEDMARSLCAFLANDGEAITRYPSRDLAKGEIAERGYGVGAWNTLGEAYDRFEECASEGFEW